MVHRVRRHEWINGTLRAFDHFFEDIESAVTFSQNFEDHHVKIYDHEGQVVQSIPPSATPAQATYA